ncbi:hypothetical protein FHU41_002773 [Psychromicrobium silvestre]|uniref:DUF4307 domain-containing protein n=1 Tax=Psychromicrobium silvestre TaxID=1645614 RepID=A0A7Y9LVS9_9MICC|nr:hypothetical protein [Psychromicrobium silvestre]
MSNPAPAQRVSSSLANRYGRPQSKLGRRGKIWLIAVAAVLIITFVSWLTFGNGPTADSKLVGFTVVNATETTVNFQVSKDPASTAQCELQALDNSFAVVGWKVVTVGPNGSDQGTEGGRTTVQKVDLLTDTLAVSADVDSCWIVNENRG